MESMLQGITVGTALVTIAVGAGLRAAPPPEPALACTPPAVAGLITDFFHAFNRGDAQAAVQIMDPQAGPPKIRPRGWFSLDETDSTGPGRHRALYKRAALARYFTSRHAQHERMRLLAVLVRRSGKRADIEFRVRRSADDLASIGITRHVAFGKGAVLCARRKIFVWSMVHPDARVSGPTCPHNAQACRAR
jgi:hypothetical protein